jgi:hypothetical protein
VQLYFLEDEDKVLMLFGCLCCFGLEMIVWVVGCRLYDSDFAIVQFLILKNV